MISNDIYEDLILFIRNKTGEHKQPVNAATLLENDLGITGDDASELIMAFSSKYKINIDNFIFSRYFYDEPNAFTVQSSDISPLTVGDLAKAIEAGKLDDDVIGS